MRSPFAAPASGVDIDPITDYQRGYLRSLLLQKAELLSKETTEADVDRWLDGLSKSGASTRIEETKRVIAKLTADGGHKAAVVRDHRIEGIEDGFYELTDGRIIQVIHAVHGSGHKYGKVLNTDTLRFDMAPGVLREVRATGKRIDDDQHRCAALGKLYGVCMCCGLELTDEASIEAGIGPVCRTGRGW